MKKLLPCFLLTLSFARVLAAQEAASGVDLRATVTAQALASNELTEEPRSGSPLGTGYRAVLYPTIKLSEHFVITAALQSISRPYDYDNLSDAGYGIRDSVLQASLGYARVSPKGSLLLRAGELSTAFGSFPLRYDDAENSLVDAPLQYGYDSPVSLQGVAGAQIDATRAKWDGRLQLANSSPSNPQSIFAKDQYANWVAGGGYTIRQGFRIGVSTYRGPFLSRDAEYFSPSEADPDKLNARAAGVDVQWAFRHWNLQGEWQTFVFPYKTIPTFREQAGYIEAKRVLTPHWYLAARSGYTHSSPDDRVTNLEILGAVRTNRFQTIKFAYGLYREVDDQVEYDHKFTVQLVSSIHLFSHAIR